MDKCQAWFSLAEMTRYFQIALFNRTLPWDQGSTGLAQSRDWTADSNETYPQVIERQIVDVRLSDVDFSSGSLLSICSIASRSFSTSWILKYFWEYFGFFNFSRPLTPRTHNSISSIWYRILNPTWILIPFCYKVRNIPKQNYKERQ